VRQIFPECGDPLGPADPLRAAGPITQGDAAAEELAAAVADIYRYPDRPWVKANFVASIDGAISADGKSAGLSGAADRLVFTVLRSLADVVVAGAGTVRAERYRQAQPGELWQWLRAGRPPAPPIAVVTRRLELDLSARLFGSGPGLARTIVLTSELADQDRVAAAARVADVVVAGAETVTAKAIVDALAARGYRRILVEGGPMLLGQLVAEGMLDELCLTLSPVIEGGHATGRLTTRRGPTAPAAMALATLLEDDGFLLSRYVRAAPA
jgi:riboflavin biosynthesis pyrimidine reductase